MQRNEKPKGENFPSLLIVSGLLTWGCFQVGPLYVGETIQWLTAMVFICTAFLGLRVLIQLLNYLALFLEWTSAHQATGKAGTASWANVNDIRSDLSKVKMGPFWGRMVKGNKEPLFISYESNALTIAPAGSGKGIYSVITNGLSIKASKVFSDFKGELICVLKEPLEKRGEKIRVLNPGRLRQEIIGESDSYNPLDIIADDLERTGGLRDVSDDLREISSQILPEPAQSNGDNTYWREGSRKCQRIAMALECIVEERDATLLSVSLLIDDKEAFEHKLRWVVGTDSEGKPLPDGAMPIESCSWAKNHDATDLAEFIQWLRAQAKSLLSLLEKTESNTFDSFVSGAQQALAPYSFGNLSPVMRRSTFSMNDLKSKDSPTSLFIVADASKMETYKSYIGLMQWCSMTAIKRHKNNKVPVHYIMDEGTNYKIHDLETLLTWGRSYDLLLHVIIQNFSAFERVYGKPALETLLSETEIKQFLPGQRAPGALELIKKLLGEQSVMSAGLSPNKEGVKENTGESGRALMTEDELRRTKYGILLVRKAPSILFEPVSYAEVKPWRKQAGINPFHGKPFLKKIKIRL